MKTKQQIEQGKAFMEGLGWDGGNDASSSVDIKNVKAEKVDKLIETLKLTYLKLLGYCL